MDSFTLETEDDTNNSSKSDTPEVTSTIPTVLPKVAPDVKSVTKNATITKDYEEYLKVLHGTDFEPFDILEYVGETHLEGIFT